MPHWTVEMKQIDSKSRKKLSIQFFWVLERCVSPSQDYSTCPFFWNPPAFKVHKSMLLTSLALHLVYTVKTIKWKSKNIRQGETSESTSIYKANFNIFPMCLLPFKHTNKNYFNTPNWTYPDFQHYLTSHNTLHSTLRTNTSFCSRWLHPFKKKEPNAPMTSVWEYPLYKPLAQ